MPKQTREKHRPPDFAVVKEADMKEYKTKLRKTDPTPKSQKDIPILPEYATKLRKKAPQARLKTTKRAAHNVRQEKLKIQKEQKQRDQRISETLIPERVKNDPFGCIKLIFETKEYFENSIMKGVFNLIRTGTKDSFELFTSIIGYMWFKTPEKMHSQGIRTGIANRILHELVKLAEMVERNYIYLADPVDPNKRAKHIPYDVEGETGPIVVFPRLVKWICKKRRKEKLEARVPKDFDEILEMLGDAKVDLEKMKTKSKEHWKRGKVWNVYLDLLRVVSFHKPKLISFEDAENFLLIKKAFFRGKSINVNASEVLVGMSLSIMSQCPWMLPFMKILFARFVSEFSVDAFIFVLQATRAEQSFGKKGKFEDEDDDLDDESSEDEEDSEDAEVDDDVYDNSSENDEDSMDIVDVSKIKDTEVLGNDEMSELDDDEMFKRDNMLSAVFKLKKQAKEKDLKAKVGGKEFAEGAASLFRHLLSSDAIWRHEIRLALVPILAKTMKTLLMKLHGIPTFREQSVEYSRVQDIIHCIVALMNDKLTLEQIPKYPEFAFDLLQFLYEFNMKIDIDKRVKDGMRTFIKDRCPYIATLAKAYCAVSEKCAKHFEGVVVKALNNFEPYSRTLLEHCPAAFIKSMDTLLGKENLHPIKKTFVIEIITSYLFTLSEIAKKDKFNGTKSQRDQIPGELLDRFIHFVSGVKQTQMKEAELDEALGNFVTIVALVLEDCPECHNAKNVKELFDMLEMFPQVVPLFTKKTGAPNTLTHNRIRKFLGLKELELEAIKVEAGIRRHEQQQLRQAKKRLKKVAKRTKFEEQKIKTKLTQTKKDTGKYTKNAIRNQAVKAEKKALEKLGKKITKKK